MPDVKVNVATCDARGWALLLGRAAQIGAHDAERGNEMRTSTQVADQLCVNCPLLALKYVGGAYNAGHWFATMRAKEEASGS